MTLNTDLIQSRFEDIQQSLERLKQVRMLSRAQFLADQDTLDITCYRLLVAIEAALHICFHISAQRLQRVPETYADCFGLLGGAGILPPELSRNLQQMTRFRNMLVHIYWDVDYDLVYDIIQHDLDDLEDFVRSIGVLL